MSIDYTASTASIFNLFALSVSFNVSSLILIIRFITLHAAQYIFKLDRYSSITQPLKYLSTTKSKSIKIILFLWVLSFLWMIPINFWTLMSKNNTISYFNRTEGKTTCNTDFETNKLFKIITTILNFYVPLFGMILIFSKIYFTIKNRKHLKEFKKQSLKRSNIEYETSK